LRTLLVVSKLHLRLAFDGSFSFHLQPSLWEPSPFFLTSLRVCISFLFFPVKNNTVSISFFLRLVLPDFLLGSFLLGPGRLFFPFSYKSSVFFSSSYPRNQLALPVSITIDSFSSTFSCRIGFSFIAQPPLLFSPHFFPALLYFSYRCCLSLSSSSFLLQRWLPPRFSRPPSFHVSITSFSMVYFSSLALASHFFPPQVHCGTFIPRAADVALFSPLNP